MTGNSLMARTAKPSGTEVPEAAEDHRVRTGAARREQTRQRLLGAAVEVFAEKGVDAPLIDDFIAAAGVARGTFYNYFKTTGELLDAVTAELSDVVMDAIDRVVVQIDDPVQRIVCGCMLYMHIAVDHPAWGSFITRSGVRSDASGKLVDIYLPRDLALAHQLGKASFPSVRAARDVVLGSVRQGIESVLSGAAPREHLCDTLEVALRGIGVPRATAHRLVAAPVAAAELPPVLRLLGPKSS